MRSVYHLLPVVLLTLLLGACTTGNKKGGLPKKLPNITLATSSVTPPHSMPTYEYPFDSSGNYVSDWAAEGERRSGRSAATDSDSDSWSKSHGGSSTNKSKVTKVSSTKSKSGSSSGSSKSKSSGGSRSHTVKKGDTLYGIALKYGTTVAKIKSANGMSSDMLKIGRVLRIPR